MKRKRKLILMLGVASVLAALASVLLRTESQAIALPDGSGLAVVKTGYGQSTHRMLRGNVWDKALYGWVPSEWLNLCRIWSGGTLTGSSLRRDIAMRAMKHISEVYTSTNTLVVWFRQNSTNATLPNLRVLPVDANGDVLSAALTIPDSLSQNASQSKENTERFFNFSFPVFPRRERDVRLRVFAQRGRNWDRVGEFKISNPAYREHPHWAAGPLPVTVPRDGYDFTLTNLLSGVDPGYKTRPVSTGEIGGIAATFRYARAGKESVAWSVIGLDVEDATGNRWESRNSRWGTQFIETHGRLPTNEALNVRATFVRQGDFDTNELWHISGVPLPAPGGFLSFTNFSTNLNGVRISLVGVSAAGVQIPNSGIGSSAPLVHFQIEPQAHQPEWRIALVSVTDQVGKAVPLAADRRPLVSRNVAFQFNYSPGMTNASFVVALNKPVTIEFMARASAP